MSGKKIIQVAAGAGHSLALDSDGQVYAWGYNDKGQLGNGVNVSSNVPIKISGELAGKNIVQIVAAYTYSLALNSDGQIYAWGANPYGQLGNNSNTNSNIPIMVDTSGVLAGRHIVQIVSKDSHSLALDSGGHIYSWGNNFFGRLGNGSTGGSRNTPIEVNSYGVLAGKQIVQIAANGQSLALDSDGRAYSWGYNISGQLGNGTEINSNIPVAVNNSGVLDGQKIIQISAGSHSIALSATNQVYAWGDNNYGQLGNGSNENSNIPVQTTFHDLLEVGVVSVKFDNIDALNFEIIDSKTIKAISPAHMAGKSDVTILNSEGKNWRAEQSYEYILEDNNDNTENSDLSEDIMAPNTGYGHIFIKLY